MRLLLLCMLLTASGTAAARVLDLAGFIDAEGAISVQHHGDTVDPYFAMQALQLAHDEGLEVGALASRWVAWLLPKQKPDATFDRFCRRGPVWAPCKTADADDALHALWIRTLELVPAGTPSRAERDRSRKASTAALARLRDPARGIYLVSPVYQHGLLMDNLEIWHALRHGDRKRGEPLAKAIVATFWDPREGVFRASTQEGSAGDAFYPDAVAQVYPLLVRFPGPRGRGYAAWMRSHRAEWLRATHDDFAWGVIAVVAWREGDRESARCWLREVARERSGAHWSVTDEVAWQVLGMRGATAAADSATCG
jgi:hypothetical protein